MNVFDLYLTGAVDSINWGFRSLHLNQRLRENGINLGYIQDLVFNEEPIDFAYSRDNRYEVFFETPDTKDYDELKLIFACGSNSIDVISVMPNTLIGTNKHRNKFMPNSQKNFKKQQAIAHSKIGRKGGMIY